MRSSVSVGIFKAHMSFCVEAPQALKEDEVPRDPHWGLENTKEELGPFQLLPVCEVGPGLWLQTIYWGLPRNPYNLIFWKQ